MILANVTFNLEWDASFLTMEEVKVQIAAITQWTTILQMATTWCYKAIKTAFQSSRLTNGFQQNEKLVQCPFML